jgi:CheY-like chemotaxis protein
MASMGVDVSGQEWGPMLDDGPPVREELMLRRSRVLLAEDDAAFRVVLATILRQDGYEVTEATNGEDVLCQLGASTLFGGIGDAPDVIVSDISMPRWTGLDVLAGLRRSGRQVPVVLMSAFGDDNLRQAAAALGARAFLDKPFELVKLQNLVRDLAPRGLRW